LDDIKGREIAEVVISGSKDRSKMARMFGVSPPRSGRRDLLPVFPSSRAGDMLSFSHQAEQEHRAVGICDSESA
jgi:hypothetical protein